MPVTWKPMPTLSPKFTGNVLVVCEGEDERRCGKRYQHVAYVAKGRLVTVGDYFYYDHNPCVAWADLPDYP